MITASTHHVATFRKQFLLLAMGGSLLISGCAVTPKPFSREEIVSINQSDRIAARSGMPAIVGAISLEEAIARSLKYNLDHRTRMLEQALAAGQLEAGRYDMMPRLLAEAGYAWRDEDNIRKSLRPDGTIADTGFISSEKVHSTADLGLHWNILDFGVGYYNAKENADRVLIALERRRRAMHSLIQNVRSAFWRAAAAEKLSEQVQATIKEAEAALSDSRRIAAEKIKTPTDTLRYQRNLLENLRLLENVERELASARIELAGLIGALPGSRIKIAEPSQAEPMAMITPIDRMEEIALTNNADLREQFYNARIAATETRRALLKLLPNLSFDYIYRYDDDKYLINNQWSDAGIRVSYNLFNIFAAPSRMKVAKMGVQVAEAKRMALQMSVLTQVHLARQQYDDALRQYQRADAIFDVDNRLSELAVHQEQSQMSNQLERIAANVTSILSSVRRYQAMAKVHEAASRVQATLGLEPQIGSLDETDLPTLQEQINQSLKRWTLLEPVQPPLVQPEKPVLAILPTTPPGELPAHGDSAAPPKTAAATAAISVIVADNAWWRPSASSPNSGHAERKPVLSKVVLSQAE